MSKTDSRLLNRILHIFLCVFFLLTVSCSQEELADSQLMTGLQDPYALWSRSVPITAVAKPPISQTETVLRGRMTINKPERLKLGQSDEITIIMDTKKWIGESGDSLLPTITIDLSSKNCRLNSISKPESNSFTLNPTEDKVWIWKVKPNSMKAVVLDVKIRSQGRDPDNQNPELLLETSMKLRVELEIVPAVSHFVSGRLTSILILTIGAIFGWSSSLFMHRGSKSSSRRKYKTNDHFSE